MTNRSSKVIPFIRKTKAATRPALRKIGMREVILTLNVDRPSGHGLLLNFLREISEETIPLTEVTYELATSFERIIFDEADPLQALRLKRRKGERKPISSAKMEERDAPVCAFIWSQLERENHKRGALTRALDDAETKFNKSRRQIESIWSRNKGMYEFIWYAKKMSELRHMYLTAEEWERMKDCPATHIDRIVLKRHKRANTKPK